jgi:hypothetical protein
MALGGTTVGILDQRGMGNRGAKPRRRKTDGDDSKPGSENGTSSYEHLDSLQCLPNGRYPHVVVKTLGQKSTSILGIKTKRVLDR